MLRLQKILNTPQISLDYHGGLDYARFSPDNEVVIYLTSIETRKKLTLMTITLPQSNSPERSRLLAVDVVRRRALDRLYERRAAIETLISSLEEYQSLRETRAASPLEFIAARKCS